MKPVTLDGWLIVFLATIPALVAWICGDEAAKFISPVVIFYAKGILSCLGVGVGALKGYRSMQFAQYKLNGGADPSTTEVRVDRSANNLPDNVTKSDVTGKAGSGS